jgi:hypothetical protein
MVWNPKTDEIWFSGREASAGASGLLALHAVSPSGQNRLVTRLPGNLGIADVSREGRVLMVVSDYPCSIVCLPPGSTKEVNLTWLDFELRQREGDISALRQMGSSDPRELSIFVGPTGRRPFDSVRAGVRRFRRMASGRSRFHRHRIDRPVPAGPGEPMSCARMA